MHHDNILSFEEASELATMALEPNGIVGVDYVGNIYHFAGRTAIPLQFEGPVETVERMCVYKTTTERVGEKSSAKITQAYAIPERYVVVEKWQMPSLEIIEIHCIARQWVEVSPGKWMPRVVFMDDDYSRIALLPIQLAILEGGNLR